MEIKDIISRVNEHHYVIKKNEGNKIHIIEGIVINVNSKTNGWKEFDIFIKKKKDDEKWNDRIKSSSKNISQEFIDSVMPIQNGENKTYIPVFAIINEVVKEGSNYSDYYLENIDIAYNPQFDKTVKIPVNGGEDIEFKIFAGKIAKTEPKTETLFKFNMARNNQSNNVFYLNSIVAQYKYATQAYDYFSTGKYLLVITKKVKNRNGYDEYNLERFMFTPEKK